VCVLETQTSLSTSSRIIVSRIPNSEFFNVAKMTPDTGHMYNIDSVATAYAPKAHTCDAAEPRIGRYKVTSELLSLWNRCSAQHDMMKLTPLAQRYKSRTLTTAQFHQYLIDRAFVFDHIERRLDTVCSQEPRAHNRNIVAAQMLHRLRRAQSARDSMPSNLPPSGSGASTQPSVAARELIAEVQGCMHSNSADEFEMLEWHCFVLYAELWFGGTVCEWHRRSPLFLLPQRCCCSTFVLVRKPILHFATNRTSLTDAHAAAPHHHRSMPKPSS
jgi:hypothetical protein